MFEGRIAGVIRLNECELPVEIFGDDEGCNTAPSDEELSGDAGKSVPHALPPRCPPHRETGLTN